MATSIIKKYEYVILKQGCQTFLGVGGQKATAIFVGHMFKNHNKWYT